jgi:hypothetical protein
VGRRQQVELSVALSLATACSFTPSPAADAGDPRQDARGDGGADASVDADTGGRVRAGLVGLWILDEGGAPTVALDTAGSGAAIDLALVPVSNGVSRTPGGIRFDGAGALAAPAGVSHLNTDVGTAGQVSLEAWVMTATTPQNGTGGDPARLATLSINANGRNIGLGTRGGDWTGEVRTSTTSSEGGPALSTPVAVGQVTHLMVTADGTRRVLYVDGLVAATDSAGELSNWDPGYRMAIGAEPSLSNAWKGEVYLVALYARALGAAEVTQNFLAGP